jgi:hypothetical protein
MNLRLAQAEKKFMGQWILANGIAWPVGLLAAIILSFGIVNRFYPKETNLIVGLCLGAAVSFSQWIIFRKYIIMGVWWILAASIGIGLPYILEVILSETTGNTLSITGTEIIDQAVLLLVGGLLTGLLQYKMFKTLHSKFRWWIVISALAWGLGWFGLILGGIIHGLITGIALIYIFKLPVQAEKNPH